MASEERSIAPSEHTLDQLRRSGQIPFSTELLAFAALAALPIAIAASASAVKRSLPQLFKTGLNEAPFETLRAAAAPLAAGLLGGAGAIALGVLLAGAIQNRFLITFAPLGFDFGKLFGGRRRGGLLQRFTAALARTALVLACFAAGTVAVQRTVQDVLPRYRDRAASARLIVSDQTIAVPGEARLAAFALERQIARSGVQAGAAEFRSALSTLLIPLLAACLFIGVVSRIAAGILFNRAHRMTRAEAEAEARETESSPQFRQARQSRYSDQ